MPRKKRRKRRPDPRGSFYLFKVTGFSMSGAATSWHPDELPDIYDRDYRTTPDTNVLHENLDLLLTLRQIDPLLPEVTRCTATLHGAAQTPVPDYKFYGGMLRKRKDRLDAWFHASMRLTATLAAALLAGRTIYVRFQGARLYRGSATLCGLEWWTSDHPDLQEELADVSD